MTDRSIDAALKVLLSSPAGKEFLSYVEKQIANENTSTIKNSQAGQAGAVPAPDTAPLTGGPREAEGTVINPSGFTQTESFHWQNNNTMADIANEQMRDSHGTNGTPYRNDNR